MRHPEDERSGRGGGADGMTGSGQDGYVTADVVFAPRLVHRVRFSSDVLDPANPVLATLAREAGGTGRVLAVLDGGLLKADRGLDARVVDFLDRSGLHSGAAPVVLPGGEAVKNAPEHAERLVGVINDARLCRRSCVLAIGGGAVLDAAGLAAATAHRGVRLIRLPTTTLSQADSCVAVKCGINAFGRKNYLGVFALPWGVVVDPAFLRTLDDRDWRCGFSEAVKVAAAQDARLFRQIERDAERIAARDMAAAWPVIRRSAEIHLRHITEGGDPFELADGRPLDFGHWAAHRLEAMSGFELRHGEAVAIGVALDATYSEIQGWLSAGEGEAVRSALRRLGFALWTGLLDDRAGLLDGLEEFREHLGGRLTVSMLRAIGRAFDVHHLDREPLERALDRLRVCATSGRTA